MIVSQSAFDQMSYLPYNNLLTLIVGAGGYDRARMTMRFKRDCFQERADIKERLKREAKGADLSEQWALRSWYESACRELIEDIADAHEFGELPWFDPTPAGLERLAARICEFELLSLNDWPIPKCKPRTTPCYNGGAPIVDIVPVEARFGGEMPDWSEPDEDERSQISVVRIDPGSIKPDDGV